MKFRSWTVPLVLLVLCVVAFALFVPFLGYYWDDWAKILVNPLFGPSGYWKYYAEDRPLSGWTHILFTPILGYAPIAWQLFTLLLRWLTAWAVWWTLTLLWPQARRASAYAAVLFLIYPVFTLQPIALTFHQQWLQYALFAFSLGAMLKASRTPRRYWLWTSLALLAILAQLSVTEYFVGNELIRPFALLILLAQSEKGIRNRTLSFLKLYAPYAVVLAVYLVWRLFFIHLTGDDPYKAVTLYELLSKPGPTLLSLTVTVFKDAYRTLISAWWKLFELREDYVMTPLQIALYGISFFGGAGMVLYFLRLDDDSTETETTHPAWVKQALALGIIATLAGMLPAWATGRSLADGFHANRYALPAMFGASLVWVSAILWLVQHRLQQSLLIGVLIAFALSLHFQTANEFRNIWKDQLRFYWQLSWRAPSIQPDTAILLEEEPFPSQGLFSTSSAVNLLYPQPQGHETLAYWVYTLLPRFASGAPAGLKIHFESSFRTLHFKTDTPATILVDNHPTRGNCLWVLSAADQGDPYLSDLVKDFLPISNLTRIQDRSNSGYPSSAFFGKEPARTWCYYYQKADLARQAGDWAKIAELGDQAREKGYTPGTDGSNSPHEWLPFIEAYAHLSRWDDAQTLTRQSIIEDTNYQSSLCRLWAQISAFSPRSPDQEVAFNTANTTLQCAP